MKDFYQNMIPGQIHEKLSESIVAMMSTGYLPYYGEFALFINFFESKNNQNVLTAGVNVTSEGMNFYWNRSFIDNLTQSESNFLLIHEEFHLLFDHVKRTVGYDQKVSNIVQDMIINQIIYDEIMKRQSLGLGTKPFISIPKDEFKNNSALFIPEEYKGEAIFEDLYEWFINKKREWQEKNKEVIKKMISDKNADNDDNDNDNNNDNDSNSSNSENIEDKNKKSKNKSRQGQKDTSGKDRYGKYGRNGVDMYSLDTIFEGEEREEQNTLDVHLGDNIPQELKREIVENAMVRLKNRGLETGDMESILNKLRKTKKDYLKEIKRTMSNHIFGSKKEKTIVRPNRRDIKGLKGRKKYKNEINVILDTSGSMGGEFEKVLSYIFQNDIEINLIQVDTQVQQVIKIKEKKELEKVKIRGLGGTCLNPGLDFIADKKNKLSMFNTVILTDGYTDSLNFEKIKTKTLILSTSEKCPIHFDNGRVKQITQIGKQD